MLDSFSADLDKLIEKKHDQVNGLSRFKSLLCIQVLELERPAEAFPRDKTENKENKANEEDSEEMDKSDDRTYRHYNIF